MIVIQFVQDVADSVDRPREDAVEVFHCAVHHGVRDDAAPPLTAEIARSGFSTIEGRTIGASPPVMLSL